MSIFSLDPSAFTQFFNIFSKGIITLLTILWVGMLSKHSVIRNINTLVFGFCIFGVGALTQFVGVFITEFSVLSIVENLGLAGGMVIATAGFIELTRSPDLSTIENSNALYKKTKELEASNMKLHEKIKHLKKQEEKNRYLALHDTLTGCANRTALLNSLKTVLAGYQRLDKHKTGAVLFLDLNNFKYINDTQGHETGDIVLKETAKRIKKIIRKSDECYRLGGDEFVVLANELSNEIDAYRIAQKISTEIKRPIAFNGKEIHTSTSIGICTFPFENADEQECIRKADMAMYEAKTKKMCCLFYSKPLNEEADEIQKLEQEIPEAIKNGDLFLDYQPIVGPHENQISFEAITRLIHPQKGIISPHNYLPFAEQDILIQDISSWAIKKAFSDLKSSMHMYNGFFSLTINLNRTYLEKEGAVKEIIKIQKETNIPAKRIIFELTGKAVLNNNSHIIQKLKSLKTAGFKFAIEGIERNSTSLPHLCNLPIDYIKYDIPFFQDDGASTENSNASVISGLIDVIGKLGIRDIIEGMETKKQYELIRTFGNYGYQGYYYSYPSRIKQKQAATVPC